MTSRAAQRSRLLDNHGLYIDPATHLAFIACEDNHKLIVVDLTGKRVLSTFDVARDPDVLAFDRATDALRAHRGTRRRQDT